MYTGHVFYYYKVAWLLELVHCLLQVLSSILFSWYDYLQQSWALTSFHNNQPKESRNLKRKYLLLLSAEFLIIGWLYIMNFIPREDLLNNMVLFSNIFLSNKCNSMGKKHFHFIYYNSYLQDDHIVNVLHPSFKYSIVRQNGLKFFLNNHYFFYSSVSSFFITLKASKKATFRKSIWVSKKKISQYSFCLFTRWQIGYIHLFK